MTSNVAADLPLSQINWDILKKGSSISSCTETCITKDVDVHVNAGSMFSLRSLLGRCYLYRLRIRDTMSKACTHEHHTQLCRGSTILYMPLYLSLPTDCSVQRVVTMPCIVYDREHSQRAVFSVDTATS